MPTPRRSSSLQLNKASVQAVAVPSGAPSWVTAELITKTLQVWQPYYDSPLTLADALAMIQAASGLFEVLSTADK